MPEYSVLLKAIVNVRVHPVQAENPENAIGAAEEKVGLELSELFRHQNPTGNIIFTEFCDDGIPEALVDVVGDEEFRQSEWFEWVDDGWRKLRQDKTNELAQRIHDRLYLDVDCGKEFYNFDKDWDADTLDGIACVVAEYIPRPEPEGEIPPVTMAELTS